MDFCERRWYLCAVFSGALLMLTFYPFYLPLLFFVALLPLYLVAAAGVPKRLVFLSGFIAGGMVALEVSFLLVVQFHWLPATQFFVAAIQYGGVVAATLIYGTLFGLWALGVSVLRGRSMILNTLCAAALYVTIEHVAQFPVGGYYLMTLSHAGTALLPLMSLASVGGALFVSFIIAWANAALAEISLVRNTPSAVRIARPVGIVLAALVLLWAGNQWYLARIRGEAKSFSIATLQVASLAERTTAATNTDGTISFPQFDHYLAEVGLPAPDLVIYPDSIATGTVSEGYELLSSWITSRVPESSALTTWNNVKRGESVYTGFQFWGERGLIGEAQKESLVPFMDYTPNWARSIGLYSMPFDISVGKSAPVMVGGVSIGGLVCSEVHRASRARAEAASASIIVAIGSEAMFADGVASEFSVRAAQYRAVENDIPVVRAALLGPSAIINADGSIAAWMRQGQGGVLLGSVLVRPAHQTLYARFGNLPVTLFVAGILLLAWRARFLSKFPGRQV
ncbi:hypothetical protein HYS79_00205 [Patescibacteria group bacterium]|nr:hypothetical protein [Patescibacteria group bacterium]